MALERGAQSELRALGPAALAERELAGEGEAVPARPEQAAARAEKAQGEGEYEEKCDCAATSFRSPLAPDTRASCQLGRDSVRRALERERAQRELAANMRSDCAALILLGSIYDCET